MNTRELIARIRKLARKQKVSFRTDSSQGKGSHIKAWYGDRMATLPQRGKDLRPGTLRAILRQLGIDPTDL